MKKIIAISILSLSLAACSSTRSAKVEEIKPSDKHLECSQIALEVNEADYYAKRAERNRGLSLKTLFHPVGYIGTLSSSHDAISASNNRIDYLKEIYKIKNCDAEEQKPSQQHAQL